MQRSEAYAIIDDERDYQDRKYPAVNGVSASPEGFLLIIEELASQARAAWTATNTPKDAEVALGFIRKIGATAVRAIEQYGAPSRA